MRHFYYYVPKCPKCDSRKTGHYMRRPYTGSGFTKEESLKHGEWVRFAQEEPLKNCFCLTCGNEWADRVSLKWWPFEMIQEEKRARGTDIAYQQLLDSKDASQPKKGLFPKNSAHTELETSYHYQEDADGPTIIDSRKKETIELLYSDDELFAKLRQITQ